MDKDQSTPFSQAEIEALKQFAAQRDDAFLILRDYLFQLGVNDEELAFLKNADPAALSVIRKVLLLELRRDVPLGFSSTMYSTLDVLQQLHPEMGAVLIEAHDLAFDYIKQQLDALQEDKEEILKLKGLLERLDGYERDNKRVTNTIAYNKLVSVLEGKLLFLRSLTQEKKEDPEEVAAREAANSAK